MVVVEAAGPGTRLPPFRLRGGGEGGEGCGGAHGVVLADEERDGDAGDAGEG